jgi:NAD-dependent SIR2 family protein deacetylase
MKEHFIITSNVDGHFQKAGFSEDKILEIHGSINNNQCNKCKQITSAEKCPELRVNEKTLEAEDPLP